MKKFASLLGEYIESSGMKQTYVATTTHISYNYLLRLLAGDRHPSEQVVLKLAETMRLSKEQTGELLAMAGYTPPVSLMKSVDSHEQDIEVLPVPSADTSKETRFVQQFYRLAQEVPELLQEAFLEEMRHLLGYARYKYVLSGGMNPIDLHGSLPFTSRKQITPDLAQQEQDYFNLIAQMVGELSKEPEEGNIDRTPPPVIEDLLSAIDHLAGNILVGEISTSNYQPQMILRMFEILREGAPWEIRRRLAEALPNLCRLDASGTEQLMSILRLDKDDTHGTDIRRRVVEALPNLFEASPFSLSTVFKLLYPVIEDDIYVALASVEACGDIQDLIQQFLNRLASEQLHQKPLKAEEMLILLQQYKVEVPRIQRQLLLSWDGRKEKECVQFSMALHDLLCAPDTMLLSLREGLQSPDKLFQIIATRYLERLLPSKPLEVLELYKNLLFETTPRNVRRAIAKALPHLLHCLEEASLPVRILARTVISRLAADPDIFIRRAVADYTTHIFYIDREFLFVLIRDMHKDKDQAIRNRLQPVALRLAQLWLTSYAETAGLIENRLAKRPRKAVTPFGE